jgi:hypothetical protein
MDPVRAAVLGPVPAVVQGLDMAQAWVQGAVAAQVGEYLRWVAEYRRRNQF